MLSVGKGAGGLRSFIIAIRLIGVLNPSSPGTSPDLGLWSKWDHKIFFKVEVEQIL